jgi:hypothetical protein
LLGLLRYAPRSIGSLGSLGSLMIDPVRARLPQPQQPHGFVFPRSSFFSAHTLISICAKTFFETLLNLSSILQTELELEIPVQTVSSSVLNN